MTKILLALMLAKNKVNDKNMKKLLLLMIAGKVMLGLIAIVFIVYVMINMKW